MNLYNAVKDTLAADPAIVRIEPRAELPVYTTTFEVGTFGGSPRMVTAEIKMPPQRGTELCKCCTVNTAWRDGLCYECLAHHKQETKQLKDLLRRALLFVYGPAIFSSGFDRETERQSLIREIEAETGVGDE